jgi:hypothetical protein
MSGYDPYNNDSGLRISLQFRINPSSRILLELSGLNGKFILLPLTSSMSDQTAQEPDMCLNEPFPHVFQGIVLCFHFGKK